MNEYEEKANDFLKKTGTTFKAEYLKHDKHFTDDKETRDIYEITLTRGSREYKFNFGQSIAESGFKLINKNTNKEHCYEWQKEIILKCGKDKERILKEIRAILGYNCCGTRDYLKLEIGKTPTAYDVLACLTTYDPEDFNFFCDTYGYSNDSIKAEKVYRACVKEYQELKALYSGEELEEMQEIQ